MSKSAFLYSKASSQITIVSQLIADSNQLKGTAVV